MPLGSTPLSELAADLSSGAATSRDLVERALAAIAAPEGEGARAFVFLDAGRARAEADASDALRRAGVVPSPLAGLPVSMKDLFDVAGEVTTAASPDARGRGARRARLDGGRQAPGGRRHRARAHQPHRIRLFRDRHQPAFRHAEKPLGPLPAGASRGDRPRAPRSRSPTAWPPPPSAAIPAARCASRQRFAASPGSRPRPDGFRSTARSRYRRRSIRRGRSPPASPAAPCSTRRWRAATSGTAPHRCRSGVCASVCRRRSSRTGWTDAVGAAPSGRRWTGCRPPGLHAGRTSPSSRSRRFAEVSAAGGILGAEAWALHRERLAAKGNMVDPRVRDADRAGRQDLGRRPAGRDPGARGHPGAGGRDRCRLRRAADADGRHRRAADRRHRGERRAVLAR